MSLLLYIHIVWFWRFLVSISPLQLCLTSFLLILEVFVVLLTVNLRIVFFHSVFVVLFIHSVFCIFFHAVFVDNYIPVSIFFYWHDPKMWTIFIKRFHFHFTSKNSNFFVLINNYLSVFFYDYPQEISLPCTKVYF